MCSKLKTIQYKIIGAQEISLDAYMLKVSTNWAFYIKGGPYDWRVQFSLYDALYYRSVRFTPPKPLNSFQRSSRLGIRYVFNQVLFVTLDRAIIGRWVFVLDFTRGWLSVRKAMGFPYNCLARRKGALEKLSGRDKNRFRENVSLNYTTRYPWGKSSIR